MVVVSAGAFMMGCTDTECESDESPVHEVTLSTFAIDRNELTQAEYDQCISDGNCVEPEYFDPLAHPMYPVTNVSWEDAQAYCAWAHKRLPTEAEWEKAARGTDGRTYPWGNEPPDCNRTNYLECHPDTTPVGTFPTGASPFGALDMGGNVWEWVADWYGAGYYTASPAADPTGPETGGQKVRRGGSFGYAAPSIRSSNRANLSPESTSGFAGFRCALSIP